MTRDDENSRSGRQGSSEPEYNVYRSRPGFLNKLRGKSVGDLRGKASTASRKRPWRGSGRGATGRGTAGTGQRVGRKAAKWALVLAGIWILISLGAFAVSAQLQAFKLAGEATDELSGGGLMLTSPQNILVIGTDARSPETLEPGAATSPECYEGQARGEVPSSGCVGTARADTLMVLRAGGGSFRQLAIPRDSYADIPGNGSTKINSAYAYGGAGLQIETVEQFLGIEIDHVVLLDFGGFVDLIDAIGGVKVDVPQNICGDISGGRENGGWTIRLREGGRTLRGEKALAYARLRSPSPCPGNAPSAFSSGYTDLDRAAAQQSVIQGIKSRIISPLRLPYNFIKGPWIGWAAPKAFVSDMGAFTLPQLVISAALPGGGESDVLCGGDPTPCGLGPDGSIEVPTSERERARAELLG